MLSTANWVSGGVWPALAAPPRMYSFLPSPAQVGRVAREASGSTCSGIPSTTGGGVSQASPSRPGACTGAVAVPAANHHVLTRVRHVLQQHLQPLAAGHAVKDSPGANHRAIHPGMEASLRDETTKVAPDRGVHDHPLHALVLGLVQGEQAWKAKRRGGRLEIQGAARGALPAGPV
jgi:hypothetical protein